MKQCILCGQFKDEEKQFARRSDNRADGYQAHCLDCQSKKNENYYQANQERIKARALARKEAIRAGTYTVQKTSQYGRQKRRVELPPPRSAREIVGFGVDDAEYTFLESESARRDIKMEQLLRELIRAAMAAREQQEEVSMRVALALSRDELQALQYPVIVTMWDKKNDGRVKRAYLEAFTEKERRALSDLHAIFYRWYLVTGPPESHHFFPTTLELIQRAANFFGTI